MDVSLSLTTRPPQEWSAEHEVPFDWVSTLGYLGATIAAGVFLVLLARGLLHGRRYRATGVLGEDERAALARTVAEAEQRTVGEIVVVVLERSDRHPAAAWMAAGLTLLLGSVLLTGWLPWHSPSLFFGAQLLLGAAGFLAARLVPGFQRVFVSEARAEEVAQEQALQEFFGHGLQRTAGATGVLLFVSLFEQRVIVLGDEGIDAKLEPSDWERADEAVLEGIRSGSLARGLHDGVRRIAAVLAEHFPRTGEARDEVPDHVIVRAE